MILITSGIVTLNGPERVAGRSLLLGVERTCARRPSKSWHVVAQQPRDRHNESSKRHFDGGQWSRSWGSCTNKGG